MNSSIPKKHVKEKPDMPWMTTEIKRMINKKHRLYNRTKKTHDHDDRERFKNMMCRVSNKLHLSYHNYLSNLIDPDTDTTSKKFLKYIKSRKQESMSIRIFKANGKTLETLREKQLC